MIYKEPGLIGHLKEGAEIIYTDELGVEWINKNDIRYDGI